MRLVLTPASILLIITPIYLLQTPRERAKLQFTRGVTNISITSELLWFIIPAMTAQSIFLVVKMVQETVEPSTWEKAKKYANKAMGVASICEMIAVYKLGLMVLSHNYWLIWFWFAYNCFAIGLWVSGCVTILIQRLWE